MNIEVNKKKLQPHSIQFEIVMFDFAIMIRYIRLGYFFIYEQKN